MSERLMVGTGIAVIAKFIAAILGLIIHIWTILIAYSLSGVFGAVIAALLPPISEFWCFLYVGIKEAF